jgi:hypothetical protein
MPNALNVVNDFFHENPDIDILFGCGWIIDDKSRIIKPIIPSKITFSSMLYSQAEFIQQSVFFRSHLFRNIRGFNVENNVSWDAELFLDILAKKPSIARISNYLGMFRMYRGTISTDKKYLENLITQQKKIFFRFNRSHFNFIDLLISFFFRLSKYIDLWYLYNKFFGFFFKFRFNSYIKFKF